MSAVIKGLRLPKRKLENSAVAFNSSLGARAGDTDLRQESSFQIIGIILKLIILQSNCVTVNQFDLPPTFIFENFWLLAFPDPSELQLEKSQRSNIVDIKLESEILTLIQERCHLKRPKGEYTHTFTCNYTLIASISKYIKPLFPLL